MGMVMRGALVGLAAALLVTTAYAEESLDEIVVTAQKRKERLQDVPIQVNVFSTQSIADLGIKDTSDFVTYVPNMTFDRADSYRNSFVVVRGLAQVTNADSPIAVVVDGVPQNDQKQFNMRLFDVQQIEVLKGPQGTLYGRDAIGGAVNIVTKAPTRTFTGFTDLSYGNGSAFDAAGGISGPMGSDKVLFRLAADYVSDRGLIENRYLHDTSDFVHYDYTVRGRVTASLSDIWSADFRAQFGRFSAASNQYSWVSPADANNFVTPTNSFKPISTGFSEDYSIKVDGHFDFATLTWISGYDRITEDNRADLDFSNPVQDPGGFLNLGIQVGQGQDLDDRIYSEELRLVSNSAGPLRWVAGASYQYAEKQLQTRAFVDLNGSPDQIYNPALVILNINGMDHNRAIGVFGQVDYDIRPDLTLTAGVRFDHDSRERRDLLASPATFENASFQAWQPKLTLSYKPTKDRTYYVTASTGYRPGGFNGSPVVPVYGREYVRNYEAGFKSVGWNERLTLNGAVFFEHDDGYQYYYVDVATASQIDQNIDQADIKGVELETQLHLTPAWQVFAHAGYTDGKVKKLASYPQFVDNHTPLDTLWTGVLGTEYRGVLTDTLQWYGRADMEFYGKKYWQLDNLDVQAPKNYLNLKLGVESAAWSAYLWGKNVSDTRAYSQYVSPALGIGVAGLGFLVPPATYGIELKAKF